MVCVSEEEAMCVTVAVVMADGQVAEAENKGELTKLLGLEPVGMSGLADTCCLCPCDLGETALLAGMTLAQAWDTYGCDFSLTPTK